MSLSQPPIVTLARGVQPYWRLCPHRVGEINWIIVAVAEEIVIAGVEELWVLAHEPAQFRVIRASSVLVEGEGRGGVGGTICRRVLPSCE